MAEEVLSGANDGLRLPEVEASRAALRFHLGKACRIVGTGCAVAGFMGSALLLAIIVAPLIRFLPATREQKGRKIRRIIERSFAAFLAICTALRLIRPVRVIGLEKIKQSKACIIIANHPTVFDIVILGSLIRDFNCVVKQKLVSHPCLGRCVQAAEYVTNDRPQEIMRHCLEGFARSQPLIIFPEGTRSPKDGLGAFSRGAAHLALRSGVPVVTATLKCDPPAFMKHQKWYAVPDRAIQYTVEFSEPFNCPAEDSSAEPRSARARALTANIEDYFRDKLNSVPPPKQDYRPAILIPNHNHKEAIVPLLERLAVYEVPCLIVDDGSEPETQRVLEQQAIERDQVLLLRRPQQGGKGAAVMDGLQYLHRAGYTHAVQMDADGQHAAEDLPKFLRESQAHPEALILGKPEFGADVPRARLAGRQVSRILVWLETFSFAIADPLVGYRVYPLKETVGLTSTLAFGQRMDFDPEIAVRLSWQGVPIRNVSTKILYPAGGLSNFRFFTDNVYMVALHLRLLAALLLRPFARIRSRDV